MNNTRSLSLVMLVGVFTVTSLRAQEGSIAIRSAQNKTTLEFKGSDGKITKTLNLDELNPYKKDFLPKGARTGSARYFAESNISDPNKSSIAVSHSVRVFTEGGIQQQEAGETTLVIYNTSGSELFKQSIQADNAYWPLSSQNLKYAAISFTGLVHDQETRKVGFSIYDIQSKSLVVDFPTSDVSSAWSIGDAFVFDTADSGFELTHTYYVFDTSKGVLYKKKYNRQQLNLIKRLESTGVVFLLQPDAERIEKYETHFTKVSK